jgi:hypothetical protein
VKRAAAAAILFAWLGVLPSSADAQAVGTAAREGWTPEGYLLSFGVGAYRPDPGPASFDAFYPGDNGPLLLAEFDFFLYRIPYVGPIGLGLAGGWAAYKGNACEIDPTTGGCVAGEVTQSAKFSIFPLNVMAVLRVDALARLTPVPFVFTGKVGFNTVFFNEDVGSGKQGGSSYGFGWAAQIALELNFVNPRRANALDEDWGINSSFFFFELGGSDANSSLPVGDKLYFTGGVGLTF